MSERADFQTVSILFRAVQALAMRIFLSFSVELISLPKYVNDSTDSIDSICCFLYIGSSNSGTTLPGGDGGGKDLFSPFEVSKTSEIPFRAKCLN